MLVKNEDGVYVDAVLLFGSDGELIASPIGSVTGEKGLRVHIGSQEDPQGHPVVIDYEHHRVHEGQTFHAMDQQLALGITTVKYAFTARVDLIENQLPHLLISVSTYSGSARIDIYEDATFTGGSDMTIHNRRRSSLNVPLSTAKKAVTSSNGNLLESFFVGTGMFESGLGRSDSEWNLKSGGIYRIDVIGLVANTQAIVNLKWYEGSN